MIAFGDAASLVLETHLKPQTPRVVGVVAYYPSAIPSPQSHFPPRLEVLVHLAGEEVGVRKNPEVLGIQGKRKTVKKRIDPGVGPGGLLKLGYKAYTYEGSEPGFAESDLDEYDHIAESVAFTRSLAAVRRAFGMNPDIERIRDEHVQGSFDFLERPRALLADHSVATTSGNVDKTLKSLSSDPHVIHVPTMTGGFGDTDLQRFYAEFFGTTPSFQSRLLSRTMGTDRVVDELFVSFTHDREMPWILPSIPPTKKKVEVTMVSIVCVRGGKLNHEHVYWDGAAVLVQVGLLDAKYVPDAMKKQGVKKLPVVDCEAARAVRDRKGNMNSLIARS